MRGVVFSAVAFGANTVGCTSRAGGSAVATDELFEAAVTRGVWSELIGKLPQVNASDFEAELPFVRAFWPST